MGDAVQPAAKPRWRWLVWLFAALGVAAAIALVYLAVVVSGSFRSRQPAIVAARGAESEPLEVGEARALPGTNLIAIEIRTVGGSKGVGSGSYSGNDLRNVLLLDRATGASRRILPDNATRIANLAYFPARANGARSVPAYDLADEFDRDSAPAYYLLTFERRLENGERVLDLLVGTLADGRQGVVMRGLAGLEHSAMLDATRLGVVVREGTALHYRVIDIPALKTIESHPIEIG